MKNSIQKFTKTFFVAAAVSSAVIAFAGDGDMLGGVIPVTGTMTVDPEATVKITTVAEPRDIDSLDNVVVSGNSRVEIENLSDFYGYGYDEEDMFSVDNSTFVLKGASEGLRYCGVAYLSLVNSEINLGNVIAANFYGVSLDNSRIISSGTARCADVDFDGVYFINSTINIDGNENYCEVNVDVGWNYPANVENSTFNVKGRTFDLDNVQTISNAEINANGHVVLAGNVNISANVDFNCDYYVTDSDVDITENTTFDSNEIMIFSDGTRVFLNLSRDDSNIFNGAHRVEYGALEFDFSGENEILGGVAPKAHVVLSGETYFKDAEVGIRNNYLEPYVSGQWNDEYEYGEKTTLEIRGNANNLSSTQILGSTVLLATNIKLSDLTYENTVRLCGDDYNFQERTPGNLELSGTIVLNLTASDLLSDEGAVFKCYRDNSFGEVTLNNVQFAFGEVYSDLDLGVRLFASGTNVVGAADTYTISGAGYNSVYSYNDGLLTLLEKTAIKFGGIIPVTGTMTIDPEATVKITTVAEPRNIDSLSNVVVSGKSRVEIENLSSFYSYGYGEGNMFSVDNSTFVLKGASEGLSCDVANVSLTNNSEINLGNVEYANFYRVSLDNSRITSSGTARYVRFYWANFVDSAININGNETCCDIGISDVDFVNSTINIGGNYCEVYVDGNGLYSAKVENSTFNVKGRTFDLGNVQTISNAVINANGHVVLAGNVNISANVDFNCDYYVTNSDVDITKNTTFDSNKIEITSVSDDYYDYMRVYLNLSRDDSNIFNGVHRIIGGGIDFDFSEENEILDSVAPNAYVVLSGETYLKDTEVEISNYFEIYADDQWEDEYGETTLEIRGNAKDLSSTQILGRTYLEATNIKLSDLTYENTVRLGDYRGSQEKTVVNLELAGTIVLNLTASDLLSNEDAVFKCVSYNCSLGEVTLNNVQFAFGEVDSDVNLDVLRFFASGTNVVGAADTYKIDDVVYKYTDGLLVSTAVPLITIGGINYTKDDLRDSGVFSAGASVVGGGKSSLTIRDTSSCFTGDFKLNASTLDVGKITVAGTTSIAGASLVKADTIDAGGDFIVEKSTITAGGAISAAGSVAVKNSTITAGGNINFSGTGTIDAVSMSSAGTLEVFVGEVSSPVSAGQTGDALIAGTTITGDLTLGGGNTIQVADSTINSANVTATGTVEKPIEFVKTNLTVTTDISLEHAKFDKESEITAAAGTIDKSDLSVKTLNLAGTTVKNSNVDADEVEISAGTEISGGEKIVVGTATVAGSILSAGDEIVVGTGTIDNSTLSAGNEIRINDAAVSASSLTADKIFLTRTQIAGTVDLNCYSVLNDVNVAGTLNVHAFSASGNLILNNATIDADDSVTKIIIDNPADPIAVGTGSLTFNDGCRFVLNNYSRTILLASAGVDILGRTTYGVNDTPADVADGDVISVDYNGRELEYYFKTLSDGRLGLYGMRSLILNYGYAAMPAMSAGVYSQDTASINRNLQYRHSMKSRPFNVYAEGHSSMVKHGSDYGFDYNTYGVLAGFDTRVVNTFYGIAVGYDYGKADLKDNAGKIEMDNYRVIGYFGTKVAAGLTVSSGISLGVSSYDINHRDVAKADTDSKNAGLFMRVSKTVMLGKKTSMTPYVGAETFVSQTDAFREEDSSVEKEVSASLRGTIGASLQYKFVPELSLALDAAFTHEFLDNSLESHIHEGRNVSVVKERISEKNVVSIGVDAGWNLSPAARITAGYTTELSDKVNHRVRAGFSYSF